MRKLFTSLLSTIALVAFASAASARIFAGAYHVSGTNPTGATYDGTTVISFSRHGLCLMHGVIDSMRFRTHCLRRRHYLIASYVRGERLVHVVYERASDGSLKGMFSIARSRGSGHEVLTPEAR